MTIRLVTLAKPLLELRSVLVFKLSLLLGFTFLLSACSSLSPATDAPKLTPLTTLYDFAIIDASSQQTLSIAQLADKVADSDVVFIGEFHGNHASHLLEMQLFSKLHALRPTQVLSMEMFNRDQQGVLDRYLEGEIGEATLIKQAPAWNNYIGSYRPLVEYAKQHLFPVIAANADADIVRCIGRQGAGYLDKLNAAERRLIAAAPFNDNELYREKYLNFLDKLRHLPAAKAENSYLSQLTRDNTMAESINQAWLNTPRAQIVHLNGSFHSESYLGTVAALKALNPQLKISVINPIQAEDSQHPQFDAEDLKTGDAIYLVQAQPEQYIDMESQQKDRQQMLEAAKQKTCH